MMKLVVCNKCNWVHMEVSREYAEEQTNLFNVYYSKLTPEKQQDYYGGKDCDIREEYEKCFCCRGPYTNFRDATEADQQRCNGSTIQPLIAESSVQLEFDFEYKDK